MRGQCSDISDEVSIIQANQADGFDPHADSFPGEGGGGIGVDFRYPPSRVQAVHDERHDCGSLEHLHSLQIVKVGGVLGIQTGPGFGIVGVSVDGHDLQPLPIFGGG
jgi:hypothetical protein